MTAVICLEFLQWFDQQMRGRNVLLLMDNFSGHELAVQLAVTDIGEARLIETSVGCLLCLHPASAPRISRVEY